MEIPSHRARDGELLQHNLSNERLYTYEEAAKNVVDILNGSDENLNTFKKIVDAYELGDTEVQSSVDTRLALYTSKTELTVQSSSDTKIELYIKTLSSSSKLPQGLAVTVVLQLPGLPSVFIRVPILIRLPSGQIHVRPNEP